MSELEQFCILARTQKGRACVALILQVLNHKKIYVFGELLDVPSIQALRETEHEKALTTLELFAYGTYNDVKNNPDAYLELNDFQKIKLKQLSIISLAKENKVISHLFTYILSI
jgi:COP9 signalosome complex subunit 7